jgi:RloB-like protein
MPITTRRARPLARDKQVFRDDRMFIIACDDTYAPKQYFQLFKIPRIQIYVVETKDGENSADRVLDRLLDFDHRPYDERWLVLDTDHYTQGTHLQSFTAALTRARQNGIRVALSKHCFELWLLLHHVTETDLPNLPDCSAIDSELKRVLGGYDKTSLNSVKFPLSAVREAYLRAQRLDQAAAGEEIPTAVTTRIYRILAAISEKAPANQLPEELRNL